MRMLVPHRLSWTLLLALSVFGCGSSVSGGGGEGGAGGTGAASSGTGGGIPGSCSGLPERPKLAVCVTPKNDPMSGPNAFNVSLAGPVLVMGDVNTPGGCFYGDASYWDPNAFWFEAADGNGDIWVAGMSFPGLSTPIAQGDTISAEISYEFGGWGPTVSAFSLRDASGELLAYAGEAGDLPELALPDGISVARGATLCSESDTCGDWSAYGLEVTAEGTTKSVGYAASETVGPYLVTHGGYELQGSATTMCADWFVAHVEVGIRPVP